MQSLRFSQKVELWHGVKSMYQFKTCKAILLLHGWAVLHCNTSYWAFSQDMIAYIQMTSYPIKRQASVTDSFKFVNRLASHIIKQFLLAILASKFFRADLPNTIALGACTKRAIRLSLIRNADFWRSWYSDWLWLLLPKKLVLISKSSKLHRHTLWRPYLVTLVHGPCKLFDLYSHHGVTVQSGRSLSCHWYFLPSSQTSLSLFCKPGESQTWHSPKWADLLSWSLPPVLGTFQEKRSQIFINIYVLSQTKIKVCASTLHSKL